MLRIDFRSPLSSLIAIALVLFAAALLIATGALAGSGHGEAGIARSAAAQARLPDAETMTPPTAPGPGVTFRRCGCRRVPLPLAPIRPARIRSSPCRESRSACRIDWPSSERCLSPTWYGLGERIRRC